ncbi:MAG: hypothetical protein WCI31_09820 [Prolixibacteraceae bacterium]
MDRKIWLRVIREELDLLNQLATGMIDDDHLTKEEVELAIARSKIVAKEFEMLLSQASSTIFREESAMELEIPVKQEIEKSVSINIPEYDVEKEVKVPEKEEKPVFEIILAPAEYQISDSEPSVPEISGENDVPEAQPEPFQAKRSFFKTENEETSLLNIEEKKEEFSIFKQAPLKSLKEGLILNDRYLFQRELFNNDKSKLDETVAALDRLANIQEAVEYLKANFRWTKSEASEKFVQLVKRRFSEPKG